jgi:2-polyprenyl-3-methyl-5-hydroxy-6-metoxy-1,4-benzoquinol methylase
VRARARITSEWLALESETTTVSVVRRVLKQLFVIGGLLPSPVRKSIRRSFRVIPKTVRSRLGAGFGLDVGDPHKSEKETDEPGRSVDGVHDDAELTQPAPTVEDPREVVTTLERLDEKLAEIDAAWSVSDDAARAVFSTFRMEIEVVDRDNPWSSEYRQAQFDLYHRISARPEYSTNNEVSGFPVDPKRPFPFYTESHSTVGDQLIGVGFIIKTMGLPAGSSILEFGPGWGNTTIALAQMGYQVTALDIDPTFVQLIKDRAALFALTVDARVGAFLDAGTMEEQFDSVLFYECFHHCSDHVQLLEDLHRIVKPGGKVFLAAEPIFDGFHAPWGLRLDGESLWAIRQNGWLELGFTESYFVETCERSGWSVKRHSSEVSPLASVFCLERSSEKVSPVKC